MIIFQFCSCVPVKTVKTNQIPNSTPPTCCALWNSAFRRHACVGWLLYVTVISYQLVAVLTGPCTVIAVTVRGLAGVFPRETLPHVFERAGSVRPPPRHIVTIVFLIVPVPGAVAAAGAATGTMVARASAVRPLGVQARDHGVPNCCQQPVSSGGFIERRCAPCSVR